MSGHRGRLGAIRAREAFDRREAVAPAVAAGRAHDELAEYPAAYERSWLHDELYRARNFKPGCQGVENLRCPGCRGVKNPQCPGHRESFFEYSLFFQT